MRLSTPILATILCLAASAIPTGAQDANKIIAQYIKAAGGSKTLSKVNTLTIEGTFPGAADEKPGTYTLITKLSNRYYSELEAGNRIFIEAYNGKSAWHQNGAEPGTLIGAEGAQLEAAGWYYNSHLINAKKNKLGLAFLGTEKVRGKDAQKVEVTTSSGLKREFSLTRKHI